MSKFQCDVDGCCCKSIGRVVISAIAALDESERTGAEVHPILNELAEFPYDINPDGSCSKLNGDLCTVYETRPLVCNTEEMYKKYWSQVMSEKDYFIQSKMTCLKLHGRLKDANNNPTV